MYSGFIQSKQCGRFFYMRRYYYFTPEETEFYPVTQVTGRWKRKDSTPRAPTPTADTRTTSLCQTSVIRTPEKTRCRSRWGFFISAFETLTLQCIVDRAIGTIEILITF